MGDLYLIRHGQASFGKLNYDELSDLGRKQARMLGQYFKERNVVPKHLLVGTMKRHRQTAEEMALGMETDVSLNVDEGWNEFDFQALLLRYIEQFPLDRPFSELKPKDYFGLLRKALFAWSQGDIKGSLPETWDHFEQRVGASLARIHKQHDQSPMMIVSSGGAIAMALKHVLNYPNESLIDMNLQSINTGVSRCFLSSQKIYLQGFNAVPHLDSPELQHMITSA